jgi:hypothetical protein
MQDFKKLAGALTPLELAWLAAGASPTVTSPRGTTGIGVGADASEYETVASDPKATARMIIKAAALARSGGPVALKPSTVAQQILDAGKRRRGESNG